MARVGSYQGWGRGASYGDLAWTNSQQFEIDGIVAEGLRNFYYPSAAAGENQCYDWSFLKPTSLLTLASAASTVDLPDDFGGFEGQITLSTTTGQTWKIDWRNEGSIREMFSATPNITGPPMFVCQTPLKGTKANQGQRFQLLVFPTADAAYTLQVRYYLNPDYLTVNSPYAYGGPQHASTIMESCLAIAEQRLNDTFGPHSVKFKERLLASIAMDRKNKPIKLGTNLDHSDDLVWDRRNVHWGAPAATYNGNSFG